MLVSPALKTPSPRAPLSRAGDLALPLASRYLEIREQTEALCEPLSSEDFVVQASPEASPLKWHLAHTTWFFEAALLIPCLPRYRPFHPRFGYLFGAWENEDFDRPARALLSRPTIEEVFTYRRYVDEHVERLLADCDDLQAVELAPALVRASNHEQRHQEAMLADLLLAFWRNPLRPEYRPRPAPQAAEPTPPLRWLEFPEGLRWIGDPGEGFAYDRERPRHRVFLQPFELGSRLVTNGEWLAFVADGGYRRPELWKAEGWSLARREGWEAPLYWERAEGRWRQMTLGGRVELDEAEPVCHLSLHEAEAYARWAGARLPTEAEWETAASGAPVQGNLLESGRLQPRPAELQPGIGQLFGDAWEWTASPFVAYPGCLQGPAQPDDPEEGEHPGRSVVLRGGSCATPLTHLRASYRKLLAPEARWQFAGLRLARDAG